MNEINVPPDVLINNLMDLYLAKERECVLLRLTLGYLTSQPQPEPAAVNGDR